MDQIDWIEADGHVEFIVYGRNNLPVDEILLPVEYPGDIALQFDSLSTAGCRTELFDDLMLHRSASTKRLTGLLRKPPEVSREAKKRK